MSWVVLPVAVFPAMIVLRISSVEPPPKWSTPAPAFTEVLFVIVTLISSTSRALRRPPPWFPAEFPLIVVLITVRSAAAPWFWIPPPRSAATFASMSEFAIVATPWLCRPAPSSARLPVTRTRSRLSVPAL